MARRQTSGKGARGTRKAVTNSARRRRRLGPLIERLEDRRLLSVALNGGIVDFSGDSNAANTNDRLLIRLDAAGTSIEFVENGALTDSEPLASVSQINVWGLAGDDTLTVDNGNGLIIVAGGIHYDGGAGVNSLVMQQTGGVAPSSSSYTPGPAAGAGSSSFGGPGGSQTIVFQNLAPVIDTVPSPSLTINANNADNSISYTAGIVDPVHNGLIGVDAFETYEFSNKTNVTINGLGGNDEISLNNPNTPTGLTSLTINAGDPSASDTLIVNGVAGQLDNLRLVPSAQGAGTVLNDNAAQPSVNFTGVEHLNLVVQQADGDGVRVDGTIGNDTIEVTPGASADSGSFAGTMDQNNATGAGPFAMVATTWSGVNSLGNDQDVNFFNPGGTDSFIYNGTANDDTIAVGPGEAGGTEFRNTIGGVVVSRVEVFNYTSATVRGSAGDDRVDFNASSGQQDNLRLIPTGVGAGRLINDNANLPNLTFTGLEHLNLFLQSADADGVRIDGTLGNDSITLTPGAAAGSGLFTGSMDQNNVTGSGPFALVPTSFSGIDSLANDQDVNFFNPGGTDAFNFLGTNGDDVIAVATGEAGGTEIRDTIGGVAFIRAELFNMSSVNLSGLSGNDTFNVGPAPLAGPLTIDGGGPVGTDVANFTGNGTAMTAVFDLASQTVSGGGVPLTILLGTEAANVNASGGGFQVLGTAGSDAFTYTPTGPSAGQITRDGSAFVLGFTNVLGDFGIDPLAGVDSVKVAGTAAADTYTVSLHATGSVQVNANKTVFLPVSNVESLQLYSFDGNDVFNVTVFNDASWILSIDGGLPAAVPGKKKSKEGDVLNVILGSSGGSTSDKKGVLTATFGTAVTKIQYANIEKVNVKKF